MSGSGRQNLIRAVVLGCLAVVLSWRLFALVDRYAVNILFWDHWDIYGSIFTPHTVWQMFDWQHGPHRQGLGMLVTKVVADISGWNTRAEAFAIAAVVCLSVPAAFVLKWRLVGALHWSDAIIPLILLTPLQWGTFIDTPNMAYGALPLLLLMLYCVCWTIDGEWLRYLLVVVISFLTTFTGFGLFIAPITLGVLLRDVIYSRWRLPPVAALLLSVVSTLAFFHHYRFDPATPDFRFPDPRPYLYPQAMAQGLANAVGVSSLGWQPSAVGWPLLVLMVAVAGYHARQCFVRRPGDRGVHLSVAVLIIFSLSFELFAAVGRISFGPGCTMISRYVTLLLPAFLGLYLHFRSMRRPLPRFICLLLLALPFAAAAGIPRTGDQADMQFFHDVKTKWRDNYLVHGDIERADRAARYPLHPDPEKTHLPEKIDYLKQHRLNFYHP